MTTYVLHGTHLEEKARDAGFAAAVADSPEKLVDWLKGKIAEDAEAAPDEDWPADLLACEFAVYCESPLLWIFAPNWSYQWEISEVAVVE